jgi:hypothetical protein
MDFTVSKYRVLLTSLIANDYKIIRFIDYIKNSPTPKTIILRHDVDRLPGNALKLAQLEHELGIHGTYYFRIVSESFNVAVIKRVAELGHEVGYHYEDIDLVWKKTRKPKSGIGDLIDMAMESFLENLGKFREIYPVETICMHGSPLSPHDNRLLWEKYDYNDYNIIGEPYFDVDFNEFLYLTDTGRRWNAGLVSVRDKVSSNFSYNFKSTPDIINNIDSLPDKIMFTIHPQRWHDNYLFWFRELVFQNIKNLGKYYIVKRVNKNRDVNKESIQ